MRWYGYGMFDNIGENCKGGSDADCSEDDEWAKPNEFPSGSLHTIRRLISPTAHESRGSRP